MARTRISSHQLTADHIGQLVGITWTMPGEEMAHSVTGELESVTQYQGGTNVTLAVGPLTVTTLLGGAMELFLHH